MKSASAILLASALYGAATVFAGEMTPEGCYSSYSGLVLNDTYQYNSIGKCGGACLALNYVTFATHQYDCYCGQELPPASTSIDNSTCSYTCPGFPSDLCGGASAYSLYLTGLTTSVTNASPSGSSTSAGSQNTASSTTTAKPSVVTVGGQTVVVTASPQATTSSSSSKSSSGPSTAGIAAGVVVGLIALSAIGGGVYLFIRQKRRREIEEEHRRQAAVTTFINGGKPPGSSGGLSFTDTRLDPAVMAQRRLSDGSIADNQDYSRRILKVTNA